MKRKSIVFSLFFSILFISKSAFAQELESLKGESGKMTDKQKISQYLKIAQLHIEKYGGPDSVLTYAQKAENLSSKLDKKYYLGRAQLYSAIGYQQKNRFDTAITILNAIIKNYINVNDSVLPDANYYLGITYYRSGDKKKALEYFLNAMTLYKKQSNIDGLALAYCKLSDVLVTDSQNKEANDYKNKAIMLLPKLNSAYAKIFVNNLISRIYMDLRSVDPSYIDSSIIYAKQSYSFMNEYKYFSRAYQVLNIISDNYFIKSDYEIGIQYCKESLKYRKYLYPGELISCFIKFSDYYNIKTNYEKSLVYLDSVKDQLQHINVQYYWLNYYNRYYEVNKNAGKLAEALYGIEKYNVLKDSLYNVDKSKEINELVQKYDKAENEKKIMELTKQKEIAAINAKFLITGVIASVFAIIIIVFFFRQSNIKNQLKTIETEQRLNRARMNPHFFFNALASLQNLSLSDSKKDLVPGFISKFSKIMRQSLESTFNEMDTIENEISFLTDYLELQKLRSENRFDYEFEVDDSIETSELLLPGMILQPFIENSIEHGFKNLSHLGHIKIAFSMDNNYLRIVIIDNGQGIKDNEKHKSYPSRATQIIKDRLYLLNKTYKTNATFVLNNLENYKGIKVVVDLPVIYKT